MGLIQAAKPGGLVVAYQSSISPVSTTCSTAY